MTSCRKVLIIDDDPADLKVWGTTLRNCASHYTILEATSKEEALAVYKREQVDCVLLDLDLRESSGLDVLFELIPDRKHPRVAVVILTKLRSPSLQQMALHNGVQEYLVKKDTTPDALDNTIQRAVTTVASRNKQNPLQQ